MPRLAEILPTRPTRRITTPDDYAQPRVRKAADMAESFVTAASWWPSPGTRAQIAKRLAAHSGTMTTAALAQIAQDNPWFTELNAEHRSWIGTVATTGINSFVEWFEAAGNLDTAANVFASAPRALARRISLNQTVKLVRSTITAVETEIDAMPETDQSPLRMAIVLFSREVAFAAAEIYARAAEVRGAWDARLEAMIVDAVIRGDAGETLISQAATLGWSSPQKIVVIAGPTPEEPSEAVDAMRAVASSCEVDVLAATQGHRFVIIVGGSEKAMYNLDSITARFANCFGPGAIVVGPVVGSMGDAPHSAREAMSGLRAAIAWPSAPRPVNSLDLLPERALNGDRSAQLLLVSTIHEPLTAAGGDLIATLANYLDAGGSVEATARERFIHPNTVRYRLKRVAEITSRMPSDPRDAYVFRVALTIGRLLT